MNTDTRLRLLLAFSIICLIAVAGEGFALWRMQDKLAQLGPDADAATVEARILSGMHGPQAPGNSLLPNDPLLADPFLADPFQADPLSSIQQMQRRFDSLFGPLGFGSWPAPPGSGIGFTTHTPRIELQETPDAYRLVIDVPEDEAIDLNTSIEDNALSITGTIKSGASGNRNNFAASQFSQSQFSRTIVLPEPVDEFGLTSSTTKDGIVVTIPKKPA